MVLRTLKARFPPPELTGDRFPLPVNMGRVDGRAFPLAELTDIFNVSWQMTSDSETTEQYLTFVRSRFLISVLVFVTGFHYPSTRPLLTGNGNRSPVNSGSGNRALVMQARNDDDDDISVGK